MLLGRVLGELSQAKKSHCLNVDSETDVSSNSEAEYNVCPMSSPELNLHLESVGEFFNRLLVRRKDLTGHPNSNPEPAGCPCSVSGVPFEWEEKPGKPKKYLNRQKSSVALTLPPVRKSCDVSGGDANLVANSPRTLSSRLRSILQPKFHNVRFYEETKGEEEEPEKVALNVLHYPEEFAWRSLRHSSPVSIFEGPDSSPSSSSNLSLLSYCSNNNNNRSLCSPWARQRHNSVPALLANGLIPVAEMLNAVPVDNSSSQSLVPVEGGNVSLPELGRAKSVKGDFGSPNRGSSNARKFHSKRSVSFGGVDFEGQAKSNVVMIPEVKLEHCHAVTCVDSRSVSDAASVVSTSVSDGVPFGPCFYNNSFRDSPKLGFQKTSRGHSHSSQGVPEKSTHLGKGKKDLKDSYVEDRAARKLMDSYGKKSQNVKVQPKRWHVSTHQRTNITSCCSSSATNTISCCSSRTAPRSSRYRERKASLSKHQKLQMDWRKLHDNDKIQK